MFPDTPNQKPTVNNLVELRKQANIIKYAITALINDSNNPIVLFEGLPLVNRMIDHTKSIEANG